MTATTKHSTDTTKPALIEEGWSVEVREARRRRVAEDRRLASRYARGPFLSNGELLIPSPGPVESFISEMHRWRLKWDKTRKCWCRKTTLGREQAALRWARRLYLMSFTPQYLWAIRLVNHYFTNLPDEVPEIRELAEVWRTMRAAGEIPDPIHKQKGAQQCQD